jgi:hypothetical protein
MLSKKINCIANTVSIDTASNITILFNWSFGAFSAPSSIIIYFFLEEEEKKKREEEEEDCSIIKKRRILYYYTH